MNPGHFWLKIDVDGLCVLLGGITVVPCTMAQRVIPTIAVKRGYNTMVLDAVRAYLQVPEDDDVFIIPPAQWRRHDDFKAHSCWKAKTVWYGERHAAQAFQEFFGRPSL